MSQNPPDDVQEVFSAYSEPARSGALALRRLIFDVAAGLPEVGTLEETLKWGQPAYLTSATKSGTTLRVGQHSEAAFALFAVATEHFSLLPDCDVNRISTRFLWVEGRTSALCTTTSSLLTEAQLQWLESPHLSLGPSTVDTPQQGSR